MIRVTKKTFSSFLILGFLLNVVLPIREASCMTAPWWSGSQASGSTGIASSPSGESSLADNRKNQEKGGEPVSVHNGDFIYQHQDLLIPSRAMSLDINRTYKSQSRYNNRFGYGWDVSYNKKIIPICNGDLFYLNGELNRYRFTYVDGTSYISPKGVYDVIVQNADGTYTLTEKHGTAYKFDQNGILTEIRDRNGNSLRFTYDLAGKMPIIGKSVFSNDPNPKVIAYDYKLIKITDTVGREITLTYNPSGRLIRIVDFSGRVYAYTYDLLGNGDLTSFTTPVTEGYPAGLSTTYSYTGHNLETITDAKGQVYLTNHYDTNDKVSQQDYNGGTFLFSYDTTNNRTTVTDPNGYQTQWTYNSTGNPLKKEVFTESLRSSDPASYVTLYTYDTNMEIAKITYPRGNWVKYAYDNKGNMLEVRRKKIGAPDVNDSVNDIVTTFTYESSFNFVKTITDPRGNVTTYDYDAKGNIIKITYPTVGAVIPKSNFTYNVYGQVETVTDPNGNITKYEYYSDTGYLKKIIQGFGSLDQCQTEFTYDTVGNVSSMTNPRGHATAFIHNALNQLIQTTSPAPFSYVTNYFYDRNENLSQIDRQTGNTGNPWQSTIYTYTIADQLETITDDLGNVTTFGYDTNGNRISIQDAELNTTGYVYDERNLPWKVTDALSDITEYTYDGNGNLNEIKDANSKATTYAYDDFDRLITTTYPNASTENYSYDKASNLIQKINRRNNTITCLYDGLNRLTQKTTPEDAISYAYDSGSRLTNITDASGSISYTYDALNRVNAISYPGGKGISYEYDANGNRAKLTYPDSSYIAYTYDTLNRLTDIKDATNQVIGHYTYDVLSRRSSTTLLNSTSAGYEYDAINRLTELTNTYNASANAYTYTYDSVSNRKTMTTEIGTHSYSYDDIYQLKTSDYPDGFAFKDTTFNYDSLGNRTSVVGLPLGTVTYTSNSINQYTQVGASICNYDLNGNATSIATNTYSYDSENRLTHAVIASPQGEAIYTYDPFGRRISKTVNGVVTKFLYDGDQIIAEYDGSDNLVAKYINGASIDETIRMDRGANSYYYHYDGLGSVTNLTDATGATVESYAYDVFGKPSVTSSVGNAKMFTGRDYDKETGLYYYRARMYSPELGRFLQTDPIGYAGGINLYAYCKNNSTNFVDPMGLYTLIIHGRGHHESGYSGGIGDALSANGETVKEASWSGRITNFNAFNQIRNEIKQAREIATARGESLNIIAHSWGGMLASSALRETGIRADNFVTMGTPYFNFTRPGGVVRYANFMEENDIFGYLSMLNLTAKQFVTTTDFNNLIKIHNSYWNDPEVIGTILTMFGLDKGCKK
jgi:RHS repeat-associated protein